MSPVNGIKGTLRHDEGAMAQCFYCKRYSLDPRALGDRSHVCHCGKAKGWSGSFVVPGPDAQWSGAPPKAVVSVANDLDLAPPSLIITAGGAIAAKTLEKLRQHKFGDLSEGSAIGPSPLTQDQRKLNGLTLAVWGCAKPAALATPEQMRDLLAQCVPYLRAASTNPLPAASVASRGEAVHPMRGDELEADLSEWQAGSTKPTTDGTYLREFDEGVATSEFIDGEWLYDGFFPSDIQDAQWRGRTAPLKAAATSQPPPRTQSEQDDGLQSLHDTLYLAQRSTGAAQEKAIIEARAILHRHREGQPRTPAEPLTDELVKIASNILHTIEHAEHPREEIELQEVCWLASAIIAAGRAAPPAEPGAEKLEILTAICDMLRIGTAVRERNVILANITNLQRRSMCLWGLERDLFPEADITHEDEGDDADAEPNDALRPNWGASPDEYVKQFRAALEAIPVPSQQAETMIRFCPGCGSLGTVDAKFRDCCPDGSGARVIPKSLANKCHDLFQLALAGAPSQQVAPTPATPDDAERYQWLRAQNWNDGAMCVVMMPKAAVKLGYDCPSLARLDDAIDAARAVIQPKEGGAA